MTKGKLPSHYLLSPRARTDLEDTWRYTAQNWSMDQADAYIDALEQSFEKLLAFPSIARERHEFKPPVQIHPSGQHVIIYRVQHGYLEIIRVLGGRQDWTATLKAL